MSHPPDLGNSLFINDLPSDRPSRQERGCKDFRQFRAAVDRYARLECPATATPGPARAACFRVSGRVTGMGREEPLALPPASRHSVSPPTPSSLLYKYRTEWCTTLSGDRADIDRADSHRHLAAKAVARTLSEAKAHARTLSEAKAHARTGFVSARTLFSFTAIGSRRLYAQLIRPLLGSVLQRV